MPSSIYQSSVLCSLDRFVGEESFFQEIFNKVILDLKGKTKDKDRKRKEEKVGNPLICGSYLLVYSTKMYH